VTRVGLVVFIALVVLGLAGADSPARAQDVFTMQYQVGFPTGNTRDFTDEVSFLGMSIGYRHVFAQNWSWGLTGGFQAFDSSTTKVVEVEGGAISGRQYRYVNAFPAYLGLHYEFGRGGFRPYLAANAGAVIVTRRLQFGVGRVETTNLHVAAAPEAGVIFPLANLNGVLSVTYNLTTSVDDYRQSHVSVTLGVVNDF